MAEFHGRVQDQDGSSVTRPRIYVYNSGAGTLASIFSDSGLLTAKENPFTADEDGSWQFYADHSYYDLHFYKDGHYVSRLTKIAGSELAFELDAREFGASPSASAEVNTAAIQSAINAAEDAGGGTVVIRPGTYQTNATLYISASNVTISGWGATIVNATNSRGVIIVAPTTLPAKTDASLVTMIGTVRVDEADMVENVHILGVTGTMLPKSGSGANLGFVLFGARDSSLQNCTITDSNGNAFEVRQSLDCEVSDCVADGHRTYGIFCFQSVRAKVIGNRVVGGERGIITKHRYKTYPCNHQIIGNYLEDIGGAFHWIIGGEFYDPSGGPLYPAGHEIVEGNLIQGNTLRVVAGSFAPAISPFDFASRWQITDNYLDAGGVAGTCMGGGGYTGSGTPGGDHLIANNRYVNVNAAGNAILGLRVSAEVRGNVFSGTAQYLLTSTAAPLGATKAIRFLDNRATLTTQLVATLNNGGVRIDSLVSYFEARGNFLDFTSATNGANTVHVGIYSEAAYSNIRDNTILLSIGSGVTAGVVAVGVYIDDGTAKVIENTINPDTAAGGTATGIYFLLDASHIVRGNVLIAPATAGTKHGIRFNATGTPPLDNRFIGTWTAKINDAAGVTSVGAQRLHHLSKSLTPASVAANTSAEQAFAFAGLKAGDTVLLGRPAAPTAGIVIGGARASADNTLAIVFGNVTAGALTPPAGTYRVLVVRE